MLNSIVDVFKNSWIRPYLSRNKGLLALVLLLGTGTFIAAGALMFTSGHLISKSATRPENILLVYIPIVCVRLFGILRPVLRYAERLSGHNMVLKILSAMRVRLFKAIEPHALHMKSRYRTGDLLGMLADDLEHLQDVYIKTIFPGLIGVLLSVLIVIALGWFSIPYALLMLLFLIVLTVLFPLVSVLVTRAHHARLKDARNSLYRDLADAVMGAGDWMFSNRQEDFISRYEASEKKTDAIEAEIAVFSRRRNLLFHLIVSLIIISMICWVGLRADSGLIGHVWIAAFGLVVFPLIDAFAPLSDAASLIPGYGSSLKRLNAFEKEERAEASSGMHMEELHTKTALPIEFSHVSFSYESGGRPIVKDVSLSVKAGEKIALLGKSGTGKSTVAKLILGAIVPDSGHITIGNKPIGEIGGNVETIISVLNQKPYLFNTTVMNNIRLGNPKATDRDVYEAAKLVEMHDYIASLPDGYETKMHELGARFSGGERQRIALARILLQNNPVVILDEPTVGLDAITEHSLLETIFKALDGRTIIWITHHLAGAEAMDRILFLEEGQIQMDGPHTSLLASNERYRSLYKLDRPLA